MTRGVVQGSPLSTALYGLTQRRALDLLRTSFPNILAAGIHDDVSLIGPAQDVFTALKHMQDYMALIGLHLNLTKTKAFSFSLLAQDEQAQLTAQDISTRARDADIPLSPAGILVAGVPIGTDHFVTEHLAAEEARFTHDLDLLEKASNAPVHGPGKTQGLFTLISRVLLPRFTYLSRCLETTRLLPTLTRLDEAVLKTARTLLRTELPWNDTIVDRLHLSVRRGGMGMSSLADTARAAYVGSMVLCGPLVHRIVRSNAWDLTTIDAADPPASIKTLMLNCAHLADQGVLSVADITPHSVWELNTSKLQHIISDELAALKATSIRDAYPHDSRDDVFLYLRAEFISGADSGAAAWLLPHHGIPYLRLDDLDFRLAYLRRLGAPLLNPEAFPNNPSAPKYTRPCKKPADPNRLPFPVDAYGTHIRADCRTLRGTRTWRHNNVQHALTQAIKASKAAQRVTTEPEMVHLCHRVPAALGAAHPPPVNEHAARADVLACLKQGNKRLIIDVTIAGIDPLHAQPGHAIDVASAAKIKQYKAAFQVDQSELKIFGMDHTGRLSTEARGVLKQIAKAAAAESGCPSDYGRVLTDAYHRVAVAAQRGNAWMLTHILAHCC